MTTAGGGASCAATGLTISNDRVRIAALMTRCMGGNYRFPTLCSRRVSESSSGYGRVEGIAEEVDQQADAFGKLPCGVH